MFASIAAAENRVARFPKPKYGRFLDPEKGAHGHERCSCCSCSTSLGFLYCYQIFLSLMLCRFSAHRNQNFSHILMTICCIKLPLGYFDLGSNSLVIIGVGDGGRGGACPPPPPLLTKKSIYCPWAPTSMLVIINYKLPTSYTIIVYMKITAYTQQHQQQRRRSAKASPRGPVRSACPHVPRCIVAASYDIWRTEMKCQFPGPTATRCCFWLTIAAMPASFSVVTVVQSRPVFTAVASILGVSFETFRPLNVLAFL